MILLCYLPAISLQKQSVGWRINLTAGFIPQGCIYYCHTTPWWCSGWLKCKMFNYSEFQFPFKGRDILLTNWRVFSRFVIILVRRFSTSKPVSTPQDACASMTALVVILWLNLRSNFTVIHSKSSNKLLYFYCNFRDLDMHYECRRFGILSSRSAKRKYSISKCIWLDS